MPDLPPAPPAPDDDERLLRRRIGLLAGGALSLAGLLIAVLLALDEGQHRLHVALHLALALQGLGVLGLIHRGRERAAALLLVWGLWAIASAVAATNGGVRGPNLLTYPVLVIFSGWLLGQRATLVLAAATVAVMLAFIVLDGRGLIPPADYGSKLAYSTYVVAIIGATAALTLISRRSWQRRLQRERGVSAELALREAQLRQLSLAVEQSPESVMITDLQARIEFVNETLLRISGYSREELIGQPARLLGSKLTPPERLAGLWQALRAGQAWSGELINRRKDGSLYTEAAWIAPIRQPDGSVTHYLAIKQDLTERQEADARIRHLSWYDPLTGLPNRVQLMQHLTQALATAGGQTVALLLLNLDRFKTVNEARGQEAGDALLKALARRLRHTLPPGVLLARIGADEFAMAWSGLPADAQASHHALLQLAQRLHAALEEPLALGGPDRVTLTGSLGLATGPLGSDDSAAELLRRCTTALHRVKTAGGAETAVFEAEMGEAAQRRFRIERELREALRAGDQLQLFLQPQVNAQGQLVGAEALVRWQHPQQGMVSPAEFVPVAEESDLIVALGRWVFTEACRLSAQESAAGRPLRLSVNLSPRQFRQPDFVDWLRELLASSGADARLLTLEVTEGLVIDKIDEVVARMHELCALGLHFAIDDFGTGYSSLAYLKRLPIAELKIDKTFVQDAPVDRGDAALVETILAVARHMQLQVVAEGVETAAQAEFLAQRAADVVYQGYLFGRPEPAAAWLAQRAAGTLRFAAAAQR